MQSVEARLAGVGKQMNMSEADVANLLTALRERRDQTVTPLWKVGAGGARCLVGYRMTAIEVVQ